MEEVPARCVPGGSRHRRHASALRLVARLWAIRDGSYTVAGVDAGMPLSGAECGDRGAALRNQDMELEVPDLFASWSVEMLHFKAGIPYTQTMIWFGVMAYLWVKEEIAYGKHRQPNGLLA